MFGTPDRLHSPHARPPAGRRVTPAVRARARAWAGRLLARRIQRKGIDLSALTFIPEPAKVPLQRIGTDPVPRLAELRATDPVHRLKLPFDFRVHLVTGHEQVRAVLADRDNYSNDIRHLFAPATGPPGRGHRRPRFHRRRRCTPACARSSRPSSPCAGWPGSSR